ncbi:MAG: hypothetical protein ACI31X_08005 [Lactobacillus amylovorus]
MRKQLDLTALTPSNSDEKVGKKPKVLNVIFSIFSSFWKINQQQLIIITYSENGIKKLGQLLCIVSNRSERSNKIKFE